MKTEDFDTATVSSTPVDELMESLDSSGEEGLNQPEADSRLESHGPNQLRKVESQSLWEILLNQFKSLIVLLLVAASLVSLIFGHWVEAIAILVVILINAAIGFFTELRAVQSMEALRQLGQVTSKVVRDGKVNEIPAEELVPGDLVVLEGGDIVTADIRLLEASKFQVDESSLTGESMGVDKKTGNLDSDLPIAERTNMVFKGTFVTRGSGKGIVVATGMETELGDISSLVEEAEEEATPLEEKLTELGNRLIWVTLAITALVAGVGIAAGKDLFLMIETAIALAVAAIPEGLPIVATLALARGMWRMAKKNALINRLSAVETLGGTDVILTDKTGTLTENKMTVREMAFESFDFEVGEDDKDLEPEVEEGATTDQKKGTILRKALEIGILCNNASLNEEKGVGDPMEISLLEAGNKFGISRKELVSEFPEVREVAFDSETKMMATYNENDGKYRVAVKGAPEEVLYGSSSIRTEEGVVELSDEIRHNLTERNQKMAEEGLRVLALAEGETNSPDGEPYRDLTFVGLVGMLDPPKKEVKESIRLCNRAGIRVVMVTGDQPVTAKNVGRAVGLTEDSEEVIHSRDIKPYKELNEDEKSTLLKGSMFARVSPRQKLDLISLHQENRSVVAMTGDGVNDAPALKKADIGIAMGLRGTQVAQQAADMILKDDSFSSIVSAIEGGRVIFGNIRRFVRYLLSCNISEIMAVAIASFVGLPLPILPLQILFLNLVTDVFPALALGFDEGGPSVMEKPPRDSDEPIARRKDWLEVGGYGFVLTVSVLGALGLSLTWLGFEVSRAVSVSFLTLAFAQLWHVFNMREPNSKLLLNHITRNPFIWSALGLCTALLLLVVYVPFFSEILKVYPPGLSGWVVIIAFSIAPVGVGQGYRSLKSSLLG
ncbi:cation-translocating P-type ATPase [Candidatus Bipolaricaulota bacterium]|nr:cation-translocating P-type ATPase [Candidatus Bipolaricaulota bacterium]